jgi:hypothetical protein
VGYRNLRDGSIGPWVADTLADRADDAVEVEDVSYHPVGLSQNLAERPPYDRLVLVGAVRRDRPPAAIEAYRWNGELPGPDELACRHEPGRPGADDHYVERPIPACLDHSVLRCCRPGA